MLVIIFLFFLPYILFQGKFYISGDDTRIYYAYPFEYFKSFTFYSWNHFSSVGSNTPAHFMAPFLLLWTLIGTIITSKVVLSYLGFSLPLVLGFLFFQIFINELLLNKKNNIIPFLGSVFLITSPILAINQLFIFLSTIWLLPVIPLTSYLFIRYIKAGNNRYLAIAVLSAFILSIASFSVPWILGYILPLLFSVVLVSFVYKVKRKSIYLKRSIIFPVVLVASQSFWFIPFLMTYFGKSDANFGSKILSKSVADTFTPTVLATATGNIFYPLLNLFHRQIAIDFSWDLRNIFYNFYDQTIFLDIIFVAILFSGIFLFKKYLDEKLKKIYLVFLTSFMLTLFFYTVNIGPLKEVFLLFGKIPGFVMFRNFFDKFALAFIIFYTIILSFSLEIIRNFNKKIFNIIAFLFILVIIFNFSQIGNIVNAPLWKTRDIGRNITIPSEYLGFMKSVSEKISPTNNILTFPLGTAQYSVIKDEKSNNVYTGTSPVKLFSGINDLSGVLSFYFSDISSDVGKMIINKDYAALKILLKTYNVNYIFVNKNIPTNVINSWIFDERMIKAQNNRFLNNMALKKPVLVSEKGNYELLKLKDSNTLLSSKNLIYEEVNPTKFKIYFKNLKNKQLLIFSDSFQANWKIFLKKKPTTGWCGSIVKIGSVSECKYQETFLEGDELSYSFKKSIFDDTHKIYSKFLVNSWSINPEYIKNNFSKDFYKENKDGSIDAEFVLYFVPQNYFYFGSIISLVSVLGVIIYLIVDNKRKGKNEKK